MNRAEFQRLAEGRMDDARALMAAAQYSGAYYLAGYAIECALKACIAKNIRAEELPERNFGQQVYTHELTALLGLAGLEPQREQPLGGNPALELNWTTVKDWNEQARYRESSEAEARELVRAIEDAADGVLPWLTQHW